MSNKKIAVLQPLLKAAIIFVIVLPVAILSINDPWLLLIGSLSFAGFALLLVSEFMPSEV